MIRLVAIAQLLVFAGTAQAAIVFTQPMQTKTAACNTNQVCPLPGGSACTGTFPGTCSTLGFDPNIADQYQDDIPVYTLVPDPTTVDPQTGVNDRASNQKLLVFLHGTGGGGNGDTGQNHLNFLHAASYMGFHVISLDYYESQNATKTNCGCDASCYGYLRNRQFDNSTFNPSGPAKPLHYAAQPYESVTARLLAVLSWLSANKPGQSWDTFLNAGQVTWSSVVMAGHSQGAGLAAFSGKRKLLAGVIMFSGIMDSTNESNAKDQWNHGPCQSASPTSSVPNWVSDNAFGANTGNAWATYDIMKYWGIRGTRDTNTCNADCSSAVKQNWDAMALNTAHFPGHEHGYGTIDMQGQNGNDYVAKGRRGLYIGSGNDVFTGCFAGADGPPPTPGTPAVSAAVTSPTPETCEATHTGTVNGDFINWCDDGSDFHSSYTKLNSAWITILSSF